jgi:hypothetical protein
MNNLTRRHMRRLTALTLAMLLLAGCASAAPADGRPPSEAGAGSPTKAPALATPTPSPSQSAAPATPPADVTFEAGSALAAGEWDVGWVEVLADTPGFSVAAPDDGNGSFSYTDDGTGCAMRFYQGSITDLDMTQDDRSISDDYLGVMMAALVEGSTREDVAAYAYDDLAGQYPAEGTVSTRTIAGTSSSGETWLHSARMFGSLGGGVYIGIVCPAGQDAQVELNTLLTQFVAIQVQATSG